MALRMAPGGRLFTPLSIRLKGGLEPWRTEVVIEAKSQGIQFMMPRERVCSSAPSCWVGNGYLSGLSIQTAVNLEPGSYTIRISARGEGKEHSTEIPLIIDADLTAPKKPREEALAKLLQDEPAPPTPPAIATSAPETISGLPSRSRPASACARFTRFWFWIVRRRWYPTSPAISCGQQPLASPACLWTDVIGSAW